jgi:hypothetical protein
LVVRTTKTDEQSAAPSALLRQDVVVAGEHVAGVVLPLDRREPLIGLLRVDRGDILLGGAGEEVRVGAVDVRCEPSPDRGQGRTSGLDDWLGTGASPSKATWISTGASGPPANGLAKSATDVSSSGALRR